MLGLPLCLFEQELKLDYIVITECKDRNHVVHGASEYMYQSRVE